MSSQAGSTQTSRNGSFVGFRFIRTATAAALEIFGDEANGPAAILQTFGDEHIHAALMGRLYYRADVRDRHAIAQAAYDNDAELAARTYLRGGAVALEKLEGEFALIVYDRRNRRVVALRDPMGGYPLFWSLKGDELSVATAVRLLVANLADTHLDIGYFGEFMSLPYAENDHTARSPIVGINRVRSGDILTAEHEGGAKTRSYWNWRDRIPELSSNRLPDMAKQYEGLLDRATRERMRGHVAAHLSGGMDSTSTALLAARARQEQGGTIDGLCLVYERFSDLALERPYIESGFAHPGVVDRRLNADDILDYDILQHQAVYDEPFSGLYRVGNDIAILDHAAHHGAQTVITGFGADEMLDDAPFYIADLLRGGRFVQAWTETAQWARAFNTSSLRVMRYFGAAPLAPACLRPGLGPLFRKGYASETRQNASTIPPWVLPGFAAEGQIQRRIHRRIAASTRSAATIVASDAFGRLRMSCGDWVRYNIGARRGVHVAHPFRDPRVMSFGLATRIAFRPSPKQQKALLAEAMKEVLPEKILRRSSKGHFNALYYAGLSRNAAGLTAMIEASPVKDQGFFRKDRLLLSLRKVALGFRSIESKVALDNSLILTYWLSLLPRWKRVEVTPTRIVRFGSERRV